MILNVNTKIKANNINSKIKKGKWFTLYYAPWCGWCKKMMPEWNSLEKRIKEKNIKLNIAKIENTQIDNIDIAKGNIYGYPTINYYNNGISQQYNNERNVKHFIKFINRKINLKSKKKFNFSAKKKKLLYSIKNDY